ncbi:MAG: phenylalanine--tRNA ligase subunit alpha [Nanoarchaeota archaeon]
MDKMQEIIEKLSPLERQIIPFLNEKIDKIEQKSGLDSVSVNRALRLLEQKGLISLEIDKREVIELGTNGIYYKKNHLPERNLITTLEQHNHVSIEEAKKNSRLSENEFKVSLGILKRKNFLSLSNGKLSLIAPKEELIKKFPEEHLIGMLPLEEFSIPSDLKQTLSELQKRKEIIQTSNKSDVSFKLTDLGKELAGKEIKSDLIEEITPELIKDWKNGKKFRKYNIDAPVPKIYAGKRHFVNEAINYAKRIWLDLGFKEMTGNMVVSSFWNFDALYQPQDHPARDMHDTFFISSSSSALPNKELTEKVKKAHESGVDNSTGHSYYWKEEEAKKVLLRTHTTCLSAQTLASLKKSDLPAKYFAIGKCFRNETIDWSHGFEFYQTEGIVIDKNLTLRHLLGYLKEFYKKMGFEKIRFNPSFFPYTEPSVEISVFHPEKKVWLELGGAGVLRPEVTIPLLGEPIPVLAWGQGFDRIITDYYKIKDLREMYSNDIKELRNKKTWIK